MFRSLSVQQGMVEQLQRLQTENAQLRLQLNLPPPATLPSSALDLS